MTLPPAAIDFLHRHSYSEDDWTKAGMSWEELAAIAEDHRRRSDDLATAGRAVREKLERCSAIHTIKMRVKSEDSVAEKIIRKKLTSPDRRISCETYRSELTDLVGIRCLHLFKEQWEEIHAYVTRCFDLTERALMYHHRGDKVDSTLAERLEVVPTEHPRGYRSVHYLIRVVL